MEMHYQEIKYNFKNYMNNSYESQKYNGLNRLLILRTIYKKKIEL